MEDMQVILEPLKASVRQVGEFLPRLLLGLVIVCLGLLVAKIVRFAVVKLLRAINFNVLAEKGGVDQFLKQGGGSVDSIHVLGLLSSWFVLLASFMVAFNSMGLTSVTALLGQVVLFLPKLMLSLVILAFGAYFARFIGHAITAYCKAEGVGDADLLGRAAHYALLAFVILIAIDQIGIAEIIKHTFLIVIGAVALGFSLAFGIGGSNRARILLERLTGQPDKPNDDK